MKDAGIRSLCCVIMLALGMGVTGERGLAKDVSSQEADEEAPASTPPEEPEEPPVVLDEIVVTAQKRTQNVQDVPVAISTLGGDELDVLAVGGADVVQLLSARVPSLLLETSFGRAFPRFYIRGLGNTDFDLNASQPVSLVYDEIVLENPVLKGMPVWDLDRVEVLRGPQGTLFGRNTPAGIVKLESAKPTQERDGYVRASFGQPLPFKGTADASMTGGHEIGQERDPPQESDDAPGPVPFSPLLTL